MRSNASLRAHRVAQELSNRKSVTSGRRTNENIIIRPLVLAQFSQRFSDFIVHRNVLRSAVLGLSRRDDVAVVKSHASHQELMAVRMTQDINVEPEVGYHR